MVTTPVIDRLEAISPQISSEPNGNQNSPTLVTLEEYRAIAETAEERLEYRNGEIFTMSGGSHPHSRIAVNIIIFLGIALRDTSFEICNGDMRIWIPEFQCGTYADVLVINGEPAFNGTRTDEILNPSLIVEVLSPSTQGYDRGEKFRKYRSIPSLTEYLLISQLEVYIEHYSKSEKSDIWQFQISDRMGQIITLPSLNIEIPLSEIYRRITGIN
jgi:Uma2 family endonuclease